MSQYVNTVDPAGTGVNQWVNPSNLQPLQAAIAPTNAALSTGDSLSLALNKLQGQINASGGAILLSLVTSENLAVGDFINIYPFSGSAQCRKAVASSLSREANGYVLVAVTAGQLASIYQTGTNTGVSGLLPGVRYFLSDVTAGSVIATPVSGSGKLNQYLGITNQTGALIWTPESIIQLA